MTIVGFAGSASVSRPRRSLSSSWVITLSLWPYPKVWGFFSVYIIVYGVLMILLMATGLDQVTAFSAVAATLNNLGPGLGDVSTGFMTLSDPAKWLSVVAMLLGRLEIFTLLVMITPTFWRT